jgi:flagellar biosynthetic protein FlhB
MSFAAAGARHLQHQPGQQQIPVQLYQAVSQVLNYVLQLKAFRAGRRQGLPPFPDQVVVPTSMSEASTS